MDTPDLIDIRGGNMLLIACQGVGSHYDGRHCGGWIRVPFSPTLGGAPEPEPSKPTGQVWQRTSGETLADITLSPSIDAHECGHFHVVGGKIIKSG